MLTDVGIYGQNRAYLGEIWVLSKQAVITSFITDNRRAASNAS